MDKLTSVEIEHEMKGSYIDYAMSVIVARALPDVRDGLKPVHRRILYAMDNLNLTPDKPFKKSATIVGDVLGKYHPHGDSSVYDALVRLAQDFNLRYPLVLGHGNFGSIDGDSAAAYRYTEAKMSKMSLEMLADIDKETVDFTDNFDASLQEPSVLPSRIPNLLVNGSMGIAVGMATNIPPHNMGDIVDALVALIENPNIAIEELIDIVKAPDFPTGALIMGLKGCREAYLTGKGTITMRAKTDVIENEKGRHSIVVTEIPYQLNKAKLIEQIADRIKNKFVTNVSDLRDESNRDGIRIVLELNLNANPKLVLNQLFKHTNLQCNFGAIMLALVNGEPKLLNLKDMLNYYLLHREDVITRRTRFELKKALARIHILEGLKIALDNIDEVIEIIRNSTDNKDAKEKLHEKFNLSDVQAQAILEMQLQRLTGLQRKKIDDEHEELTKFVEYLNSLLADELKIKGVIRDDLLLLKEKYSEKRRTHIVFEGPELFETEDLIPEEDVVISVSESGYIKRMPLSLYNTQRRGGRGKNGASLKEDDYIRNVCVTTTHSNLFFLTDRGKMYRLKVYEIPESGRNAKGTAIVNLLSNFANGEKIKFILSLRHFSEDQDLVIATTSGFVKRTSFYLYRNMGRNGLIAVRLNEGDEIASAKIITHDDSKEFMVISKYGKFIRFSADTIRAMGRNSAGYRTFKFDKDDDKLVAFLDVSAGKYLLIVTSNGFAVRTPIEEYAVKGRRGKGTKVMEQTDEKGFVAGALMVNDDDEIMVMSREGVVIRTNSSQLPEGGRIRVGNTFMNLDNGDVVSSVAIIKKHKEDSSADIEEELPSDFEVEEEVRTTPEEDDYREQTEDNTEEQTEENNKEQTEENVEEQIDESVEEQEDESVEEQEDESDNEQKEFVKKQIEKSVNEQTYEFEDENTEDSVSEVKGNYQRHFNIDGYPIASEEDAEDSPVDLEEESQKDDLPEDLDSEEELKKKDE